MSKIKNFMEVPFNFIRNRVFLFTFLNGFMLALLVYFYTEDNYESQIFNALAEQVKQTSKSTDERDILLASVQLTHNLEKFRYSVFGNKEIHALKSEIVRPVTFDLMTGSGACGSYSYVLGRLLEELQFEVRFAQMKVGNNYGGHIVIEVKTEKGWAVLDPSYNLHFDKSEGEFASFNDVKNNWNLYRQQLPVDYDLSYNYAGVRYTNWEKVPVVMPMVKKVFSLFKGKEATEELSLRAYFIKKFNVLLKFTLVLYVVITMFLIRVSIAQHRNIQNFNLSMLFARKSARTIKASLI
jgi:hypothetical protein